MSNRLNISRSDIINELFESLSTYLEILLNSVASFCDKLDKILSNLLEYVPGCLISPARILPKINCKSSLYIFLLLSD